MKRKKFYILITLLISMIIFSTAAISNQCGVSPSTTTEKVGGDISQSTEISAAETTASGTTAITTITSITNETTAKVVEETQATTTEEQKLENKLVRKKVSFE